MSTGEISPDKGDDKTSKRIVHKLRSDVKVPIKALCKKFKGFVLDEITNIFTGNPKCYS